MNSVAANRATARKMWLGVLTGFLLLATAWTAFIILARHTRVESVPLATKGVRP